MDIPNITIYTKGSPLASVQNMMGFNKNSTNNLKIDGLTIEMIIKFRTNFKLNLFSKDGSKLISNDAMRDEEVHYVKFEGAYPEFEFSPESLKKSLSTFNFKDWTIVDFDNYLQGNPHI